MPGKPPQVRFASSANEAAVSRYSLGVLGEILSAAGLSSCVISSTARTPADQARVMFENCEHDASGQRKLYLEPGQQVIDVWENWRVAGWTREETIEAMRLKIIDLGPCNVSRHCANHKELNVVDVAPSSVQKKMISFERAVRADSRVSKFLVPPRDPAYHIEIPQVRGQV